MLSGARRVGKTTIPYQLAQEALEEGYRPHEVLYVSFDHPILKLTPLDRILEVFRVNIAAGSANVLLLLDEIHHAQDWSLWLKLTVDRNPRYRVVATGSASTVLGVEGTESGVGRWVEIKIPTLSFYEYAELLELERPRFPADLTPASLPELPAAGRRGGKGAQAGHDRPIRDKKRPRPGKDLRIPVPSFRPDHRPGGHCQGNRGFKNDGGQRPEVPSSWPTSSTGPTR